MYVSVKKKKVSVIREDLNWTGSKLFFFSSKYCFEWQLNKSEVISFFTIGPETPTEIKPALFQLTLQQNVTSTSLIKLARISFDRL